MPPLEQFRNYESDRSFDTAIEQVFEKRNVRDTWESFNRGVRNTAYILGHDDTDMDAVIIQTENIEVDRLGGITPVYDILRTIIGPDAFIGEVKDQIAANQQAKPSSL